MIVDDRMIKVDKETFAGEVLKSEVPVLVAFWAPGCKPCRTVAPTLSRIADDFTGRAKVVHVNTDDCPEVASHFSIIGLPTTILFHQGAHILTMLGVRPREEYARVLGDALGDPSWLAPMALTA